MVSSRTPNANVTSTVDGGAANDGGAASSRDDEGRATNVVDREWSQSEPASLSMSTDLRNLVISHLSDSGRYSSASPDHHHHHHHHQETTSDVATIKIGCHDEEESYEGFGSVEGDSVDDGPDSPGGSSSAPSPTGTNSRRNPRSPNSTVGRHSWLRTSLRRTPPCSSRKRLSSNALASQLYRSGSFNSTGMGSNYDATDDVYSDVSLEDVMDLSHKTARTGMKQDAAHNVNRSAEFQRCTEDRGESTSPTNTTITRPFVNPDYEEDDDDDRYGSENQERKQDAIFMRPGSIHRILTN